MGYKGHDISDELDSTIDKMTELCLQLAEPKFTYGYFNPEYSDEAVTISGTHITLRGNDIYRHLKGAKYFAVMAVTLGMNVERKIMLLEKTSMTEALIFDSAANACIESAAEYVNSLISEESKSKNMYTNYRYSPGYGDFPIEMQNSLIPLLRCQTAIGLSVTENSIMIPRKSITAIIGVFDSPQTDKTSCEMCSMYHKCNIRKDGGKCAE